MLRCIRCLTKKPETMDQARIMCDGCVEVTNKFMCVGVNGICWNCAEFVAAPGDLCCTACGFMLYDVSTHAGAHVTHDQKPLDEFLAGFEEAIVEDLAERGEHGDDVLAAVANPEEVSMGLSCRSDTAPYELLSAPQAQPELPTTDVVPVSATTRKPFVPRFPVFKQALDKLRKRKPAE